MKSKSSPATVVVACLVAGLLMVAADRVRLYAQSATTQLSDVDRLRAENAVLRANLNEAQRQIVELTGKLLAADRLSLAEKIKDTYHADLDWQTLLLKPVDLAAKEKR